MLTLVEICVYCINGTQREHLATASQALITSLPCSAEVPQFDQIRGIQVGSARTSPPSSFRIKTKSAIMLGCLQQRQSTHFGTNRPPRKWRPLNPLAPSFGAVKLIKTSGSNPTPCLFPSSTSQPDGMSTDTMGRPEEERRGSAMSKGARTGGLKEKPKMASKMTS